MRIVDLLGRDSIYLNGKASGKTEVIDMMVSLMEKGDTYPIRRPISRLC